MSTTREEANKIAESITKENAFPFSMDISCEGGSVTALRVGLSKREYFAGLAMQALIISEGAKINQLTVCSLAATYADELIKQLDR